MSVRLSSLRDRLRDRLAQLRIASDAGEGSTVPVELDQSSVGRLSRVDAMQVQAMALAAERRRKEEIARVEAALQRIEEDDFGYCIRCGDSISERRLEADPSVTTCIGCASGKGPRG